MQWRSSTGWTNRAYENGTPPSGPGSMTEGDRRTADG
jgi:hypothetical protein